MSNEKLIGPTAAVDTRSSAQSRGSCDTRDRSPRAGWPSRIAKPGYWLTIATGVALGVYIRREALWFTFYADDYAQLSMLEGTYPLTRAPWDLFNFSNGTAAETRRLVDAGFYPWWTDAELRLSFMRPLASLMTWLDHRVFVNAPFGYHAHSAAWWCVMLLAVGLLYAKVLPRPHALIAFFIVAFSIAHEVPFWWICNRSVLGATTLSVLSLLAYRKHRTKDCSWALAASVVLMSLAFLLGEYAFCALGYFIAYEVHCARGSLRRRASSLVAVFTPAALFIAARMAVGASALNSGVYLDPIGDPLAFLAAALVRVPVLIGDLLFVLQAGHWTVGPLWLHEWFHRGWVSAHWLVDPSYWRSIQTTLGYVACVATATVWWFAYRRNARSATHWLTLGSLLALIPVVASFPSSRLLVMAVIGFSALLADLIQTCVLALLKATTWRNALIALAGASFFAYHLLLPVSLQRARFSDPILNGMRVRDAMLQLPTDEAELPGQDVVLLSALELGSSMYLPATRRINRRPAPRSCMYLSFVPTAYVLTRVTTHAFDIRFPGTTVMLNTALEQLFRPPHRRLRLSESIEAGPFRATVLELQEGLPKRVRFTFEQPLESPSLLFMITAPDGFKRFQLPPIGQSAEVPAPAVPAVP